MRIRVRNALLFAAALAIAPLSSAQIPLPKPGGHQGSGSGAGGAGGTHRGPGDSVPPPGASTGGGQVEPGHSGPASGAPCGPTPPGPSAPARPAAGPLAGPFAVTSHEVGPEEWWTWWQLHKVEFLRPNLLRHWVETVTGFGGGDEHPALPLQRLRDELLPRIARELTAGDPSLRGAAALAYGRIAGAAAIDGLLPLLRDPSTAVRERALFAIGMTGAPRAAELLLRIARTGAVEEGRVGAVTPDARALAVFALAVGRRNGLGEAVDHELAKLASEARQPGESLLATSLLLYQTLAPSDELKEWAFELARDEHAPPSVRCRALETLRTRADEAALFTLVDALDDGHADVRRSAGLALGELDHPLALSRLITACAEEREPLARGFLLISIGRKGGDAAERFLIEFLDEGAKTSRPFAALGLAILARDAHREQPREALRRALIEARSAQMRSALYLALGIARDQGARDTLAEALQDASDPESRAAAAFGLAMLGNEEDAALLEEQLGRESNPVVRAELAQALGYMGQVSSVDELLDALTRSSDPWLRASTAYALGLHGTRAALETLMALCAQAELSPSTRAATFEALQLVLGRAPSLTIGELLRQANFAVFPPTLIRLRAIPL